MDPLSWILLVEDDPDHQLLIQQAIRRFDTDMELFVVDDFEGARGWLTERHEAGESVLDGLIILDLGLPGPSGFTLLEWLPDVGLDSLPVFILTASRNPMDADHAFNLGAKGYFQKPADFREYTKILDTIFEKVSPPTADEGAHP